MLIGEGRLPEKISSWTVELKVAQELKNGIPPQGQGYQGVIFYVMPKPENVIVSLRDLYSDPDFTAALEREKGNIDYYHSGAGRHGNDQNEVVLELDSVTQEDVHSLGGHSSPFEKLVDEAAKQTYGPNATAGQRDALILKADHVRDKVGPSWLSLDATRRVVENMKPHAERLREIRRRQDDSR